MYRSGVRKIPECLNIVHSGDKYCGRTLFFKSVTDNKEQRKNILILVYLFENVIGRLKKRFSGFW